MADRLAQIGIQEGQILEGGHEVEAEAEAPSQWRLRWRILARDKAALAGLVILLVFALGAILAPLVSPYDPNAQTSSVRFGTPTLRHLLGTDEAGRDILSRLIWGGRVSLFTGVVPTAVAAVLSLGLGLVAGYFGGLVDQVTMRILDVFFAFPIVLLAILFAGVLGPGVRNEAIVIIVILIPYMTRVVRTAAMSSTEQEYVEAARAAGAPNGKIVLHEVLPNVLSPLLVYSAVLCGLMILVAAGLSFFGLGPPPPASDWGQMVNTGRTVLFQAPHVSLIPSICIVIVALAFNFLGDGLRDVLDPHYSR